MPVALETGVRVSARARSCGAPLRLLSDEQLARRIAAGNREAFTVVYDRHLPALTRYCRSILRVAEDAEDAAQNAMIAALRSLPGRAPQLKLRAWLFRVAHNEAISIVRRRRHHESLESAADASSLDVAETAAVRARLRQLLGDLEALPERQRAALVLRELSDLGYDEIAGVLGCSEATAMQTVFEARSALTQFEDGRTMTCGAIQRVISDGDRRQLRARRIRAHMRSCDMCRTFALSLERRRSDLALLVPACAAKGAFAALLAISGWLGGAHRARLQDALLRVQSATPSLRGAAASVLLVAGGVTTGALYHDPQHAQHAHGSHPAHATLAGAPASSVMRSGAIARTRELPISRPGHRDPRGGVPVARAVSVRPAIRQDAAPTDRSTVAVSGAQVRSSQPSSSSSGHAGTASGAGPSGGTGAASGGIQVGVGRSSVQLSVGSSTGVQANAGSDSISVAAATGTTGSTATASATVKVAVSGCLLLCQ